MKNRTQHKRGINIFLFKRDLRLRDNIGFFKCLEDRKNVLPVYIFEEEKEEKTLNVAQQNFVYKRLLELKAELEEVGSTLLILSGNVIETFSELMNRFQIFSVYFNKSFDPFELQKEADWTRWLNRHDIDAFFFSDYLLYEPGIVMKKDDTPYTVYSPFKKKWRERFEVTTPRSVCPQQHFDNLMRIKKKKYPTPSKMELGIKPFALEIKEPDVSVHQLEDYEDTRNFPAINGTTNLSVYLRFGVYSIRRMSRKAYLASEGVLNEFIWREFFAQILWFFPESQQNSFKSKYDFIEWRNDVEEFEKWCQGKTGYPIVDAGMRELNATGYMHNRVRMVTASFLCKHLLIDWRWGETYFASKLLDYDRAANVGNWQWAAGTGCDAMPYHRIFNPHIQLKKFDQEKIYCEKWIPELDTEKYCSEMITHETARERALKTFQKALSEQSI